MRNQAVTMPQHRVHPEPPSRLQVTLSQINFGTSLVLAKERLRPAKPFI
jgi:hypothetical protein